MSNPVVCVPMKLDAYVLNPTVCSPPPASTIAPITQPNYTFLRIQDSLLQPDIMPHHDLHAAANPNTNSRITDLGTGDTRTKRIGVYLHWMLPRLYRTGTASTSDSDPHRAAAGFAPLPLSNPDPHTPAFRTAPNRYLIIRRVYNYLPTTAPIPEFTAFIIESDRLRNIDTLTRDVDLEVDVSPYTDGRLDTLESQAEIFIGFKSDDAMGWKEKGLSEPRVPVSVLNSSNQLFADYVPHNSNVFSMLDRFEYRDTTGALQTLTEATADYTVLGWHSADRISDDPFTITPAPGSPLATHGSRIDGCNMVLPELPEVKVWLESSESTSVLTHGTMYNVSFSSTGTLPTPANDAAALLHNTSPVAVGTNPLDAMMAFVHAHLGDTGSADHKLMQDLERIQGLLLKQEEDLDSQWQAADMLSAHNFAPSGDGGSCWNFSGAEQKRDSDEVQRVKYARLGELNAVQEAVDAAARQLRVERWGMWALWWKYLTTPHPGTAEKDKIKERVARQSGAIEALERRVKELSADVDARAGVLENCKKGAAQRFYSLRDPTILIGGVENPWPRDFGEKVLVRLDTQLVPAKGEAEDGWKSFDNFVNGTVEERKKGVAGVMKVLPNAGMQKAAKALLMEFLALAPQGTPKDDERAAAGAGGVLPLYSTATKEYPRRDKWEKQPWFPLFLEWELEYFHISFKHWAFESVQVEDAPPRIRYGIREDGKLDADGSQKVSGRVLILPQASSSMKTNIEQLFANTSPAVLRDVQFGDAKDRARLLQSVDALPFLSAPLSGFTEHLTTRLRGTHIKPTRRRPGEQLDAIPTAQISSVGIGRTQVLQMGAETATTPYGSHVDVAESEPSPFKPVAHGQFRFTKLNIIDKFGQAISAIDPATAPSPPPLYPIISEYYRPQIDASSKRPITITQDPPGHCQYAQIPPNINQDARLNAYFLTRDNADMASPWRPAAEWETPMWGWLVVNYAQAGLQFFLPNGTFYREVRLGGVHSATQKPPWAPFPPPDIMTETTQLDRLLKRLKDDEQYLRALITTINAAVDSIPHPPSEYAAFMSAIVGRPLALVNMGYSLELATTPLTDQSQGSHLPPAKPVLDYEFRVKLGDSDRVYDGLIGYFTGTGNTSEDAGPAAGAECDFDTLYTYFPNASSTTTRNIGPEEYLSLRPYHMADFNTDPIQLRRRHNSKLTVVAGIVDPFTAIHAYSGILPIRPLVLPQWSVQSALKTMTAFFSVGPLLVTTRNIEERARGVEPLKREVDYAVGVTGVGAVKEGTGMPVPVPGGEWMWLQPVMEEAGVRWCPLGLEAVSGAPRFQEGPYSAVEGYLQLRKAMG